MAYESAGRVSRGTLRDDEVASKWAKAEKKFTVHVAKGEDMDGQDHLVPLGIFRFVYYTHP